MARVSLDYLKANRPQVDQAKIDATTEADIRRHMVQDGQDPDAEPVGYRAMPSPADIRAKLGLTQVAFADALGVPAATLRNWEQGRKLPDPAARSLLMIFDREPAAALRALVPGATIMSEAQVYVGVPIGGTVHLIPDESAVVPQGKIKRVRKYRRKAMGALSAKPGKVA